MRLTHHTNFGEPDQIVPEHVKQRDSTPGMRFFGKASGYSPLRWTVDRDYDLSPDFTCKKRKPDGIKDAFKSTMLSLS